MFRVLFVYYFFFKGESVVLRSSDWSALLFAPETGRLEAGGITGAASRTTSAKVSKRG